MQLITVESSKVDDHVGLLYKQTKKAKLLCQSGIIFVILLLSARSFTISQMNTIDKGINLRFLKNLTGWKKKVLNIIISMKNNV